MRAMKCCTSVYVIAKYSVIDIHSPSQVHIAFVLFTNPSSNWRSLSRMYTSATPHWNRHVLVTDEQQVLWF